jgi:hypothetical protein
VRTDVWVPSKGPCPLQVRKVTQCRRTYNHTKVARNSNQALMCSLHPFKAPPALPEASEAVQQRIRPIANKSPMPSGKQKPNAKWLIT